MKALWVVAPSLRHEAEVAEVAADPFFIDLHINGHPGDELIVHDYDGWVTLDNAGSQSARMTVTGHQDGRGDIQLVPENLPQKLPQYLQESTQYCENSAIPVISGS